MYKRQPPWVGLDIGWCSQNNLYITWRSAGNYIAQEYCCCGEATTWRGSPSERICICRVVHFLYAAVRTRTDCNVCCTNTSVEPPAQALRWAFCVCYVGIINSITPLLPHLPYRLRVRFLRCSGANVLATDASPQIQGLWRDYAGHAFRCCCSDDHQRRVYGVAQGAS